MAERQPQKAKKRLGKTSAATVDTVGPRPAAGRYADRIAELEAERNRLSEELDAAKAKIRVLEQARDQAVNHIDWVIDSLHSLRRS